MTIKPKKNPIGIGLELNREKSNYLYFSLVVGGGAFDWLRRPPIFPEAVVNFLGAEVTGRPRREKMWCLAPVWEETKLGPPPSLLPFPG